jgi:hypothetical protein
VRWRGTVEHDGVSNYPNDRSRVIDQNHPGFKHTGWWLIAEAVVLLLLILGVYFWKRFG